MSASAKDVLVANALRRLAEDVTSPTLSRALIAELLAKQADVLVDFEIEEKAA